MRKKIKRSKQTFMNGVKPIDWFYSKMVGKVYWFRVDVSNDIRGSFLFSVPFGPKSGECVAEYKSTESIDDNGR